MNTGPNPDDTPSDPHAECAVEIHRLGAAIATERAARQQAEAKLPCGHPATCLMDDLCGLPEHRFCHYCHIIEYAREGDEAFREQSDAIAALTKRAEQAEMTVATMRKAFEQMVTEQGVDHDDFCPEDSTCECPSVLRINRALSAPPTAMEAYIEALEALCARLRAHVAADTKSVALFVEAATDAMANGVVIEAVGDDPDSGPKAMSERVRGSNAALAAVEQARKAVGR